VISGAAAASGLNAIAAPHNPALATTLMLNRSTIAISVDSFIRAQTFPQSIGAQNRMPYRSRFSTTEPIVSSQCET
jgi:hypothetical protein